MIEDMLARVALRAESTRIFAKAAAEHDVRHQAAKRGGVCGCRSIRHSASLAIMDYVENPRKALLRHSREGELRRLENGQRKALER